MLRDEASTYARTRAARREEARPAALRVSSEAEDDSLAGAPEADAEGRPAAAGPAGPPADEEGAAACALALRYKFRVGLARDWKCTPRCWRERLPDRHEMANKRFGEAHHRQQGRCLTHRPHLHGRGDRLPERYPRRRTTWSFPP
jgi:hypothetical protein